jgi:DNA-binding CsgD family transcriptional regulator/predicted ester cyclase
MVCKNAIVNRFCNELFSPNHSVVNEILHFTFTAQLNTGLTMQRSEVLHFVGKVRKSFSNLKFQIEDSVSDGDKVAVRGTLSGVLEEGFYRFPATFKSFSMPIQAFFDFLDDRISSLWFMVDQQQFMRQLGLWKVSDAAPMESNIPATQALQADCTLFTERELAIIRFVSNGYTSKEIGTQLHLSPRTIEKYEEHIRLKLHVPNRAGVIAWAVRSGLLDG